MSPCKLNINSLPRFGLPVQGDLLFAIEMDVISPLYPNNICYQLLVTIGNISNK